MLDPALQVRSSYEKVCVNGRPATINCIAPFSRLFVACDGLGWLFEVPDLPMPQWSDKPFRYSTTGRDLQEAYTDFMCAYNEVLLEMIQYYIESACEDYVYIDRPVDMPEMYYRYVKARSAA